MFDWYAIEHWLAVKTDFGLSRRLDMYHVLKSFAQANISPQQSFRMLESIAIRQKKSRRLIFRRIQQWLKTHSLTLSLKAYLPQAELNLVMAGETSGDLVGAFENAGYIALAAQKMRAAMTTQLFYGGILFLVALGLTWMSALKIVPVLERTADLSPSAVVLASFSGFLRNNALLCLIGLIATVFLVAFSLGRWKPNRLRRFLENRIPPYSTYRIYQSSTLLIVLGALMEGGRPIDQAIKDMMKNASPWLMWHLTKMSRSFLEGAEPHEALDTGILSDEEMGLIQGFSEAGCLDQELPALGKRTVERSITRIQIAGQVLSTAMLLATASMASWLLIAMISSAGTILSNTPFS